MIASRVRFTTQVSRTILSGRKGAGILRKTTGAFPSTLRTSSTSSASYDDNHTILLAAAATMVAGSSAFAAYHVNDTSSTGGRKTSSTGGRKTLCDAAFLSNPSDIYHETDEGDSPVFVKQVPYEQRDTQELEDGQSDYNKSIRAFEACFDVRDVTMKMEDDDLEDDPQHMMGMPAVISTSSDLLPMEEGDMDNVNGGDFVTTRRTYFCRTPPPFQTRLTRKLMLFACQSSAELGSDIARMLGQPLNKVEMGKFSDGETKCQIQENVRGKYCFLICSTTSSDAIMELMIMIATLRRSSAKHIAVVIPYYGYSRQDRKTARESIAAADLALMIEKMGADRVIGMDLHNESLAGFFAPSTPVENLVPVPVAAAYLHEEFLSVPPPAGWSPKKKGGVYYPDVTVVASHEGQVARANQFRKVLQQMSGNEVEFAFISKNRQNAGEVGYKPEVVGNVKGRRCVIVDDMVNTGSTLCTNTAKLNELGVSSIYAWATHGIFNNVSGAPEMIAGIPGLEFLLISNSIMNKTKLPPKIRQLNVAQLLAEAIGRTLHNESVSSILQLDQKDVPRYA